MDPPSITLFTASSVGPLEFDKMNRGLGPQIDIPVGVAGGGGVAASLEVPGGLTTTTHGSMHQPGWNGLTIKEILEKVDLFNITVDDGGVDTKGSDKVLVNKNGVKQKVRFRVFDDFLKILGKKRECKKIKINLWPIRLPKNSNYSYAT